ncbi:putative ribonuclease H-like domain-containing protein [Tanacetum coccineum]
MAGSEDDIPLPPPPPSQTPTQQTPHTVSTIKLPILNKGEYDIWAMKMKHYLAHTDYPIWEVIQRGNCPVSVSTDTNGLIKVLPPKTIEEILAKERERKARTTLLMALPEDHLSLLSQLEIHGACISTKDANKKFLRVFESDVKGSTASSSSKQNVVFISENTSSTNNLDEFDLEEMDLKWQVAMISMRMKKFYKKTGRKLQFDAKEPVSFDKTNVECYSCHKTGHFARECRSKGNQDSRRRDAWNTGNKDRDNGRRSGKQEDSKDLVTLDGEGVDWTSHSKDEQENYALIAYSSSGLDIEVTSCSKECKESYAKLKKLYDEQREQLRDANIEIHAYTQALKKVEAQLVSHQQSQLWYEKRIRFMKINLDDKTDVLTYHKKLLPTAKKEKEELKDKVEKWHNSSKNLNILLNSQMSARDKAGLGYGDQMNKGVLSYENEVFQSVFVCKTSDIEDSPVNDRYAEGMHAVPPPITGTNIPSGPDKEIDDLQFTYGPNEETHESMPEPVVNESNPSKETHESMPEPFVNEPKVVSQPKVWSHAPIIEEYESDSEDEHVSLPIKEQETPSFAFINIVKHVKTPRQTVKEQNTCSQSPKLDKKDRSGLMSKKLGLGYGFTKKACFVCGSFSHLIRDYDFHEKRMAKQAELNNRMCKASGQRENRPVWNNIQRVNHQNKFIPKAVLTRTCKIQVNTARTSGTNTVNTARHNFNRQAVPTNAARKVNTVKPIVNNARPKAGFHKTFSPFRKPFNNTTALRTNFSYQKVNTAEVNAVSAVGGKGKLLLSPQQDYPQRALQNKEIVDSGCSRHMTGNKAYLAEYQDFNGGPVAFGGSKGYITGKGKIKTGKLDFEDVCFVKELQHFNLFSVSQMCDKKNKVLFTDTECLVLSPEFKLPDENQVLLRIPRQNNMYSFNLENIVPSGGLACLIAKATIDESNKWHRRLGHVNFKNLNKLVKGNLASWVFFLRTKDETSGILKDFIRQIHNLLNQKVKTIRCDNGIEFKNRDFIELYGSKGIKREYSNARTPQQNGVAERKNRTLFEAARTMLVDSFLPNTFWAEAVRSENQANKHAGPKEANHSVGTEDNIDAGSSKIEAESAQDYFDANDAVKALRKEFAQDTEDLLFQAGAAKASNINTVNTASTPVSTASPYGGLSFTDLTNTNQDDSEIPALEYIYDNPTAGIFTNASYDDEGDVANFTNLETIMNKISEALEDESWVDAMQEELLQFKIQKVWILIDLPYGKKAIGKKWVYRNKKDERGVMVRNKERIEAVRIFLAITSYMGFIVYQMDVKSAFLYGKINEEVYVSQAPSFVDSKYPKKVYKVVKALYGLHQALKAWYATLSTFFLKSGYRRGTIDKTLFIKKDKNDIMLVQVYVDDIIFGSTKRSLVRRTKTLCLVCHILYSGGRDDIAEKIPKWLPHAFNSLKCLYLVDFNFGDFVQLQGALCLLRNSPNLESLHIFDYHTEPLLTNSDAGPVSNYLESPYCLDQTLNKLKTVKTKNIEGSRPELLFIKLLLAHSPSLEKFTIQIWGTSDGNKRFNIDKDVMHSFPRASQKAEMIYMDSKP